MQRIQKLNPEETEGGCKLNDPHDHPYTPQCRLPGHRSRASSLSLTVESALESFDFLNTSDFDDEDNGDDGAVLRTPPQRSPSLDMEGGRMG